jgi:alpha-tubulin suppressor-like RCC1 family protein
LSTNDNDRNTPGRIGTDTDWETLSLGYNHSFAIKTDGSLWAWGANDFGQLGNGPGANQKENAPVRIGTETNWAAISIGAAHTLAIKNDGTLWAWGRNYVGQLGTGNITNQNSPVQIGTETDWMTVAAGYTTCSFAIKTNGSLWAWGENNYGQLGIGDDSEYETSPVRVGTDTDWSSLSSGRNYTLAIKTNGSLWAWGRNNDGQLGIGNYTNQDSPVQTGTETDWINVLAGGYHVIAKKSENSLWAWGYNWFGQLGDGTTANSNVPVRVVK